MLVQGVHVEDAFPKWEPVFFSLHHMFGQNFVATKPPFGHPQMVVNSRGIPFTISSRDQVLEV